MSFTDRLGPDHLCIFLLHGVTQHSRYQIRNYTGKHIQEAKFDGLLKELTHKGHALSMDEVIEHHQTQKTYPPNSFSITFDDGFENNASVALPLLEKYNVPALIYITTGWTEVNGMSWTDRLEYCLEHCEDKYFKLPWHEAPLSASTKSDKIILMNDIRYHVKRHANLDIETFIEDFYQQADIDLMKFSNDPLDLKLTWQQLKELHFHPLITIGGHTHSHRVMSFLSDEDLKHEINLSLELLQKNSSISTHHYSYPEGLEHTYNQKVIEALTNEGIKCSPSAIDGINNLNDSLFDLKRILVG